MLQPESKQSNIHHGWKFKTFNFFRHVLLTSLTVLLGLLANNLITAAQEQSAYFRLIRTLEYEETGLRNPAGVVFIPTTNTLGISQIGSPSDVVLISIFPENLEAVLDLPVAIPDTSSLAFSVKTNSFYFFNSTDNELVQIPMDFTDALSDPSRIKRFDLGHLDIERVQGITMDPDTGNLIILDAADPEIVVVAPGPSNSFNGEAAAREGRVRRFGPAGLASGKPRGIAVNPNDNHIYVMSPSDGKIFKIAQTGRVVAFLDLAELSLENPLGMTFAASGNPTDDPGVMNLYIADGGVASPDQQVPGGGQILELSLAEPISIDYSATALSASLVNTIDTSQWSPPSPDPAGVVYRAATDTLLVSDSEVNEMDIFEGKNFFEATRSGNLAGSFGTLAFSNEPTGLGINPSNGHIFVSDDTGIKAIYEVNVGTDGEIGTGDDIVNTIDTATYGQIDTEDVAYGEGKLFIADGVGEEVYIISPGSNGVFDGGSPDGDDLVAHFDTTIFGARDPEGIDYNPDSGTLFIVSRADNFVFETTLNGAVINTIDIAFLNAVSPAGIAYAPSSQNPSVKNIYIAARGVDNGSDPDENDGKIYEITYAGGGATPTPSNTASPSNTPTPSSTPTNTPTPSDTPTHTSAHTATQTNTPTPSNTPTPTSTNTATEGPSPTPSNTPSPTATHIPTETPSDTPPSPAPKTPDPINTPTPSESYRLYFPVSMQKMEANR